MIFALLALLLIGALFCLLAALTGPDMRHDAQNRDRVARLFRDPYCRDRCDEQ